MSDYDDNKCARCGSYDGGILEVGLGVTLDYDVKLCADCRTAWVELGIKDPRFVTFRNLTNMMSALKLSVRVTPRSPAAALDLRREFISIRNEQMAIGAGIYYFAKTWARGDVGLPSE